MEKAENNTAAQAEREVFEAHFSGKANLERNGYHPEFYAHLPTRQMWDAWQARAAHPAQTELVEALKAIYEEDFQVPHGSTESERLAGMKRCIFRIRRTAQDALAAQGSSCG